MTDRATALALLRRQLDDDRADFRPGQWEAIDSIVNDTARLLVVQRTGWGKSSVYFIATRILRDLRQMPDNLPVLGTTATANDRVIEDVQAQLGRTSVQRGPLMRDSLRLQTMRLPTQAERLAWLADHIDELPGTGIIYTLTKRDAEQVSSWLNQCAGDPCAGVTRPYYSGVTHEGYENSNAYRRIWSSHWTATS